MTQSFRTPTTSRGDLLLPPSQPGIKWTLSSHSCCHQEKVVKDSNNKKFVRKELVVKAPSSFRGSLSQPGMGSKTRCRYRTWHLSVIRATHPAGVLQGNIWRGLKRQISPTARQHRALRQLRRIWEALQFPHWPGYDL